MDRAELKEILIDATAKATGTDPSQIAGTTNFANDLNVRSIAGLKICAILNSRLGKKVNSNEVGACATIDDCVDYLEKLMSE